MLDPFCSPFEHPNFQDLNFGCSVGRPSRISSDQGRATLRIKHRPYPRLAIRAKGAEKPVGQREQLPDFLLGPTVDNQTANQIDGTQGVLSRYVKGVGHWERWHVNGFLDLPTNAEVRIGHLVGHLYNFESLDWGSETAGPYGCGRGYALRSTYEFGSWRLHVDSFARGKAYEDDCKLGRYTLTNVFYLEKQNQKLFGGKQALDVCAFLELALGFIAGAHVGPSLAAGRRVADPFVWLWPGDRLETPANRRQNWASSDQATGCMSFLDVMWTAWKDGKSREWLERAIPIYIEASRTDLTWDVRIAVAQTGVEMMASLLLTEVVKSHSLAEYVALHTAGQVEALLTYLQIETTIPDQVSCRPRSSKGTLADAVVDLRNAIVHPTSNNRGWLSQQSEYAYDDAWNILLEFLELAILKAVGYEGQYSSFLDDEFPSTLPWLAPQPEATVAEV